VTRTSALTTFTGLVGLPLLVVSAAALARSFGVERRAAAMVGLLAALTPAVVVLGSTTYVDVLGVACGTAASALGLRALDAEPGARRWHLLVLAGLATGLAVGTKATYLIPLAVLWLALLVVAARRGLGARGVGWTFLAGIVPSALVGGYWFARKRRSGTRCGRSTWARCAASGPSTSSSSRCPSGSCRWELRPGSSSPGRRTRSWTTTHTTPASAASG